MKWERDGKIYMEIRRTMLADLHSLIARLRTYKGRDTRARHPDAGLRTEPGERRGHGGPGAGAVSGRQRKPLLCPCERCRNFTDSRS